MKVSGEHMDHRFRGLGFGPADILLPKDCDWTKWSVIACDQFTSQPEYWERVARTVGGAPSTLRLILPEGSIDGPDVAQDTTEINLTMAHYLRENRFTEYPDSLIYVERTLSNGKVRRGLVGMVDLEDYEYESGAVSLIRATEDTVLSRIPPRVRIRKNAPIELPHVMLLADDPGQTVIEPLAACKGQMTQLYDFELMEQGGHLAGWLLDDSEKTSVAQALRVLAQQHHKDGMLYAVGDGNHSLSTAKACYERQKGMAGPELAASMPARYALVELNNLHDAAIEFHPIHRVLFGVEPKDVLHDFLQSSTGAFFGCGEGQVIRFLHANGTGQITLPHPTSPLPVGSLQSFLDRWVLDHGGRIDYIHGADAARHLGLGEGCLAFLLPTLEKAELFPIVARDGALPRKTFSIGQAGDKRYYLEARRIR